MVGKLAQVRLSQADVLRVRFGQPETSSLGSIVEDIDAIFVREIGF